MLHINNTVQILIIFAIAAALAFGFGFQTLFMHTAVEAVWWGMYYLGSLFLGLFIFTKLPDVNLES